MTLKDPNWIEYNGNGMPCLPDTEVTVLLTNGEEDTDTADTFVWTREATDEHYGIVGYRFNTSPRTLAEQHDPVNHPKHYTAHPSGVECIQITEHMGFCLGNAVKYIWRADLKLDAIEDLKKARWYIDRELEKRTK